jgi:hypothetical protein
MQDKAGYGMWGSGDRQWPVETASVTSKPLVTMYPMPSLCLNIVKLCMVLDLNIMNNLTFGLSSKYLWIF